MNETLRDRQNYPPLAPRAGLCQIQSDWAFMREGNQMNSTTKALVMAVFAVALIAVSTDSEARRGRRSSSTASSTPPSAPSVTLRTGSGPSSGPSTSQTAVAVGAAAVAGAAVASIAPRGDSYEQALAKEQQNAALSAKQAQTLKETEDKRKADEEAKLRKLAAAADIGRQQREQADAQRRAEERAAKVEAARKAQLERERACVIKPVMTDAEMEGCKRAWN